MLGCVSMVWSITVGFHHFDEVCFRAFAETEELEFFVLRHLLKQILNDDLPFSCNFCIQTSKMSKHFKEWLWFDPFTYCIAGEHTDHDRNSMTQMTIKLQDNHTDRNCTCYTSTKGSCSKDCVDSSELNDVCKLKEWKDFDQIWNVKLSNDSTHGKGWCENTTWDWTT